MNPVALDLGYMQIYWYSIFIFIGMAVAIFFVSKEAAKFNIPKDFIVNLAFWVIIFGLIGARLYFVAFHWADYQNNLIDILKVWKGGLAIHGGIIAGLLVIFIYTKKYKIKLIRMTDIIAPALLIAQAIGRWGNFFNQEAHGGNVSLEFLQSLFIPDFIIEGMNIGGKYCSPYCHPTFLYESLWCLLGFIIILIIRRFYKYLKLGQITGFYLVWYSSARFFIEILRTDSLMFMGFKVAQIASVALFVIGIVVLAVHSRGAKFDNLYKSQEGEKDVLF